MSELRVMLPSELRAEVARRAGGDFSAEAAWVAVAVREKLAVCAGYLEARGAGQP